MFPSPSFGLALLATGATLAVPAAAQAIPRTWVAGNGSDANACTHAAPCATLQRAIPLTDADGVVSAVSSGAFGGTVNTISKSITIDLRSVHGGLQVNTANNGFVINAPPATKVVLRGLVLNGTAHGLDGLTVFSASSVKITDSEISGFTRNGLAIRNAGTNDLGKVVVQDSYIHDNTGNGIVIAPATKARVTLRRNNIDGNGCGVSATRLGLTGAPDYNVNCGTGTAGGGLAVVNMFGNSIFDSARQAVLANGNTATIRLSRNEIAGSISAPAIQAFNGGSILSYGNNFVTGNPGGNGAVTGSVGPTM